MSLRVCDNVFHLPSLFTVRAEFVRVPLLCQFCPSFGRYFAVHQIRACQNSGAGLKSEESTYSECAAATQAASAANLPRSLQYPSSPPMIHISFATLLASVPEIFSFCHVARRPYNSAIMDNRLSEAFDASSGREQTLQSHSNP